MKGFISLCGLAPGGEEYDGVESNVWLWIAGDSPPRITVVSAIVSGIAPAGGVCNNVGSMVSSQIVGDGNGTRGGETSPKTTLVSANVCGILAVDKESNNVASTFTSRIVVEGDGIGGWESCAESSSKGGRGKLRGSLSNESPNP